jgi:hypothetical protein
VEWGGCERHSYHVPTYSLSYCIEVYEMIDRYQSV